MSNEVEQQLVRLPLYRRVLEQMVEEGLDYGKAWPVKFFEDGFRCGCQEKNFHFELMGLRRELEEDHGYYLRKQKEQFEIVPAEECEDVAKGFERRMNRFARRSVTLRRDTLRNEKAVLSDAARSKMEHSAAQAATRLALLMRRNFSDPAAGPNPANQKTPSLSG